MEFVQLTDVRSGKPTATAVQFIVDVRFQEAKEMPAEMPDRVECTLVTCLQPVGRLEVSEGPMAVIDRIYQAQQDAASRGDSVAGTEGTELA